MRLKEKRIQRSFRLRETTLEKLGIMAQRQYRDVNNMLEVLIETAPIGPAVDQVNEAKEQAV